MNRSAAPATRDGLRRGPVLESDMAPPGRGRGATVGLVVAACAACCAGPVIVAVGGLGAVAAFGAFVVWPAVGLVLAVVTVVVVVGLRRRRSCPAPPASVMLSRRAPRES